MKNLLAKFLAYNREMLAKASSHNLDPHYQSSVWMRAAIPARSKAAEHGWMGGHPNLPDPFQWPSRGGQPYQFLCQINCASLPRDLWGGLGPRTGWLAIFAARTGQIDVKVIYAPALGSARQNDNAWSKASSSLGHMDDKFDQFLGPPPKWQLKFVENVKDAICVPDRLRQRPSANESFRVAVPENQPFDWTTLELLVSEAFKAAKERTVRFAETVREWEARLKQPSQDLTNSLNEMIAASDQLLAALHGSGTIQPFSRESWLAHRSLISRIKLLDDEFLLHDGRSFESVVNIPEIARINNQGLLRTPLAQSPIFLPDSAQGRAHADLMRLATDLESDLRADARIPPPPIHQHSPNFARWKEYRESFPQDWQNYANRALNIRKLYGSLLLENAVTIAPVMQNQLGLLLPETLDKALNRVEYGRKWAVDQLAKMHNINFDEEIKRIDVARQKHNDCENLAARLDGVVQQLRGRKPDSIFSSDEWNALYRILDEGEARELLLPYWNYNYKVLRSEMAKRLYCDNPENIPSEARLSLESEWTFDAEQATFQMGGTPRGWCKSFVAIKPESIMLLQVPTNNLTNFSFGDVDDLVISITRRNLEKQNFETACVDVSN